MISYRDIVEICFFSGICYYFISWLRCDTQKPLLLYFYLFSCTLILAFYCDLPAINWLLLNFSPTIIIGFFMIHQHALQKNFITLHHIKPIQQPIKPSEKWLNILIRTLLNALNKEIEVWCIIEQTQSLETFLTTGIYLNVYMQESLITLLLTSQTIPILVITKNGSIKGCYFWNIPYSSMIIDVNEPYKEAAFLAHYTDALIIHCVPRALSFTVLYNKEYITNLSASGLLTLLQKILATPSPSYQSKKDQSICDRL